MKHTCEFSDETEHGYKVVQLGTTSVELQGKTVFCEVGASCLEKCPYSYDRHLNSVQIMIICAAFDPGEQTPFTDTS